PGPDDGVHVGHILAQAGAPISGIVLTHGHHDHWGALAPLKAATRAPIYAWHQPFAPEVRPDVPLRDGAMVGPLRSIHTPGHAPDHLCFVSTDGTLFSGDVVMGWSTTVIGGRGGDMAAYFGSLDRLLATESSVYLPGHGPPLPKPRAYVSALRGHRQAREASIVKALVERPMSLAGLTDQLYPGLDPALRRAAEANVSAHLDKLEVEGRAMPSGAGWTVPS
ncbi:MAG: MBL fold metallo-hydrolase, partial [Pseudomonadota bacterium]|nr:MBL fold metallo-hydrolase [Pseudomonadota bacterium]